MLWLYLHFHSLQLDSTENSVREPKVVVDKQTNQVVQLNAPAKELGIKEGMGLAMAVSMSNDVHVMEYKPEIEQERLLSIAAWLYEVTADISLDNPQGLFIRIDNMLRLYDSIEDYWGVIGDKLSSLKVEYSFGAAPIPLMAKLVAFSKKNKLYQTRERSKEYVSSLPLDYLAITPKQKEQLKRVGIQSIGELLKIPMKSMAKRFDLSVFTYLGQLSGDLKLPMQLFTPTLAYNRTLELLFEISNAQVLTHPIQKLLNELELFLCHRALVTSSLEFTFLYRYNEGLPFIVHRAGGEYKADAWLTLIKLQLESTKLTEPVVTIKLACSRLEPIKNRINDLFDGKQSRLEHNDLLSKLVAKLGHPVVNRLRFCNTIAPETSSQLQSSNDSSNKKRSTAQVQYKSSKIPLLIRPSFIKATPTLLSEAVTLLHGPERILTSWWLGNIIYRDYFVARSEKGQWLWVFRTPEQQWYIQGIFS